MEVVKEKKELVGQEAVKEMEGSGADGKEEDGGDEGTGNDGRWANVVCPDGRKFSELNYEEKKKMRKKLRRKEKATESKQLEDEYNKLMEGKDPYELEVAWCINQLKLGLTRPGVSKEQGS